MACTPSSSAAGEGLASVGSRPDDQGSLRSAIIVPAASAVGGPLDLDGGWTTVQNKKKEAARRRRAALNSLQVSSKFEMDVPETKLQNQISMPSKFEFHYLKKITNQFSKDLILGSGGFGIVYKGEKENGIVIAVKKLSDMQGTDDKQFLNEIKLLMDISHPNIVRVEGYCYHSEGELTPFNESYVVGEKVHRLLCFEYLPRGSLDKYLSDEFSGLEWQVRYNIIHGICKGLYCLHEDRPGATILHLDLKPQNVLLDKHMIPKIADFGHSRLFGKGKTHSITVNTVGTRGYMAPEYIDRGMLAKEADIFSLGVILMEILTGYRKYPDNTTSQQLNEIKDKWRIRLQATLNKPSLEEQCGQINLCIIIAFKCMERDPEKRLNIKEIIEILGPRSVQEDGSDVEEQKWEVVPLEWRESLDIVALRSPEQSIKGMDVILRELLRIFETESTVPQYIIKDADRLVSYLSAMAEKTSRLILKGATSMSLDYFAGRFTINTLTQAFNIRDLAKAVKDDTLEKLLRDLLIWSTVNKDSELSKSIKMLLHKIQENAERTAMLLVLMNLLRPLDPGRWPSCATPVPLRERTHIYSQLVSGCLDTVAKNFLATIEEFDLDRILSSIQIYLEEIGVEEINKREKTKDTGLVAVMDVLAELVHIRGPVIKDHHSMARVDVGRQPIILAYIDKFLKPGYKTARARLKEMSDKRKTQEKMTSLKQLPEIQYDYLKKITNNFAEDRKISESALGSLYKGIVPDDGKVIAVKKLLEMSTDSTFEKLFHNIMVLKHENIVQIVGYGSKTSKKFVRSDKGYTQIDFFEGFICYEYLPNGSLEENLFGTKATRFVSSEQDWDARFKIINGICCGLRFLHKLDIPIIHMDLKPENILLDANMVPKIAGFELSRVLGQEHTRVCTQTVQGSYGYMAPEYLYRGEISAQTDIYSLGLMILEITTGEKNSPEEKQPSARKYIENVQNTWTQEHIAFKKSSLGQVGLQQVEMCIKIGLDCVCIDRKLRPSIETIVDRLYNVATRVLLKQGSQVSGDKEEKPMISQVSQNYSNEEVTEWLNNHPLVGRESQMNELCGYTVTARFSNNSQVISVWGIAGVGKSALVRNLYYDRMLKTKQFNKYSWVDVSHPFNLRDFSRSLLSDFGSEKDPIKECRKLLGKENCLVVIDDLQSKEEWDLIQNALVSRHSGSVIIVITTDASVAAYCTNNEDQVFNVKVLEADASMDLFRKEVERTNSECPLHTHKGEELDELISKCGGLPEVIISVAALLATQTVTLMDTVRSLNDKFMHHLETDPDYDSLRGLFDWMYNHFRTCPDSLKPCIFYLSIFPRGHNIRRRGLVRRWIAEGYFRDSEEESAVDKGENFFTRLLDLSIIQQIPQLVTTAFSDTRMVACQVNGFIREYIVSRRMEENLVFELGPNCVLTTQRTGRHLIILDNWDRDIIVFESIDFSRLRSLTVIGKWESFFISKSMRLLRVLDLEDASGLKDEDLKTMVQQMLRLKFLSLRGHSEIFRLPNSLGNLRQLQTLDVRHTSIVTLPASIGKLKKLQYIRAGTKVPASTPMASSSRFRDVRRGRGLGGVKVPKAIGKLTALHTLGVINVGASGGKAVVEELKKLTQLRKLGVSGINKHNSKEFFLQTAGLIHLESLLVQLDDDSQSCLDDNSLSWKNLQSLTLYGLKDMLPLGNPLSKLSKLDLEMDTLQKDGMGFLAKLPALCIVHLRVKQLEDGKLHFHAQLYGEELDTFEKVKILEVTCRSSELHVIFGSKSMKKLDLLKIDCTSASYHLTGLNDLSELKEVLLKGTDATIKTEFERQLISHPKKPTVKLG